MKKLWRSWVGETREIINEYAKWIFAALILNLLILANIALVLIVLASLKHLLTKI